MSIDIEYAIKKDIRNNPVVREVDTQQKRDLRRTVCLAVLIVGVVLFSAWQHYRTVNYGYQIEQLRLERASEEAANRQLRLNFETLRAPGVIDRRARRELGLVAPTAQETLVLERAPVSVPSRSVVANAR
jgi:cell division protein FtsL